MIREVPAKGVTMVGCSGTAKQLGHTGCTQICETKYLSISGTVLQMHVVPGQAGKQAVRICSTMCSNNTPIQGDVGKNYLSVISVARRALWIQSLLLLR